MRPDGEPMTTTTAAPLPAGTPAREGPPVLDVVIPVYNEQTDLEPCVRRLRAYLTATFPYPFRITVADNASTDGTGEVARRLAAELPEVVAFRLEAKGRGRALAAAWAASASPVLAYMDVDLSTDLAALLPLVAPLLLPPRPPLLVPLPDGAPELPLVPVVPLLEPEEVAPAPPST